MKFKDYFILEESKRKKKKKKKKKSSKKKSYNYPGKWIWGAWGLRDIDTDTSDDGLADIGGIADAGGDAGGDGGGGDGGGGGGE